MADPIPIYFITGTLGSGKTTLMNRLLTLPRFATDNPCLLVNEFGELGIDGQLIDSGNLPTLELSNGSIFCVCIRTDFVDALNTIATEVKPGCVIAEATGMAEPRDLQDLVQVPELHNSFRTAANICVVDAQDFLRIAPLLRSARHQAACADALIINKCDLVNEKALEQLENVLRQMNPRAPITRLRYCNLNETFFGNIAHHEKVNISETGIPDPVFAVSITRNEPVGESEFRNAIAALGDHLLRIKGQVDFGKGPQFVEYAGGEFITSADRSIQKIAKTPTALVAIGWNIRQADFTDVFNNL